MNHPEFARIIVNLGNLQKLFQRPITAKQQSLGLQSSARVDPLSGSPFEELPRSSPWGT